MIQQIKRNGDPFHLCCLFAAAAANGIDACGRVGWFQGELQSEADSVQGADAGASVKFSTTEGEKILVKVAISYTDRHPTKAGN